MPTGLEKFEMMTKVVEKAPPELLPTHRGYNTELSQFIKGCLRNDPAERYVRVRVRVKR